jgi:hypothetical protein
MGRRTRSLNRWIRMLHRWISMTFVALAAVLIIQVVPQGPVFNTVSVVAILFLVLLALTGGWMAVHHYLVRLRHPRVRRPARLVEAEPGA